MKPESNDLQALRRFCAFRERSCSELKRKAISLDIVSTKISEYEEALKEEGFLNDSRFATLYVRSKLLHNKWGFYQINQGLSFHGIKDEIRSDAWNSINSDEYTAILQGILLKKWNGQNGKDLNDKKQICIRFALSKGFQLEETLSAFKELSLG